MGFAEERQTEKRARHHALVQCEAWRSQIRGLYDWPFVDQGPRAVASAIVARPPEDERATRPGSVVLRDTIVPGYLGTQKGGITGNGRSSDRG